MPASKAQQAITAQRRARALTLRVAGLGFDQIAEQLGYASRGAAYTDIERALAQRKKDLDEAAGHAATLELERLDAMERAAWAVLRRTHTLVSQGRIVKDDTGRPLADDEPTLKAIDRLLGIQQRRAKLLRLDAPTQIEAEVRNVDAVDAEIERLVAQLAGGRETAPTGSSEV